MRAIGSVLCLGLLAIAAVQVSAAGEVSPLPVAVGVPMVWSTGPSAEFQGRTISVPAGVAVATDGSSYFYASTNAPREFLTSRCAQVAGDDETRMAFIDDRACAWAAFPAVACSGTDLCAAALGVRMPAGPALERTANSSLSTAGLTVYDYVQVGVQKVNSVYAYGFRTQIAMTDLGDDFSTDSCHYRWGGLTESASLGGSFLQAGTQMCSANPGWWAPFCYGHTDSGWTWSYWGSLTQDTNAHYYSVAGDVVGSYNFKCKQDSTTLYSYLSSDYYFTSPMLNSIGEITGPSTGLDPSMIDFRPISLKPAVEYHDSMVWTVAPSQDYITVAWNRDWPYETTNDCSIFNIGTGFSSFWSPYGTIVVGTGQPCRTDGSTAW